MTHLIAIYASLYVPDNGSQLNMVRLNGTPVFVAIIQREDSPLGNVRMDEGLQTT